MDDRATGPGPSSRIDRDRPLPPSPDAHTPVIVVTGPGRAGKAALFRHLLNDPAWARVVTMTDTRGGRFTADQPPADGVAGLGCVCCVVQGDLQRSLREYLPRARRGEMSHIVVDAAETVDPLSILTTLIADPALAAVYRIGGVVAVVDRLDLSMTDLMRRQVTLADGIIIGDAVGPDTALRDLNPVARLARGLPDARFLLTGDRCGAPSLVEPRGTSVLDMTIAAPLDWPALCRWLTADGSQGAGFAWSDLGDGAKAWRVTGRLQIAGEPRPVAIEAVRHRLAPPRLLSAWPDGQPPRSRLIFMGDGLDAASITASVRGCAVRWPAVSG
jgi:G3E family GTPase